MHYFLVIVLLASWSVVQSQTWAGTYTPDTQCNQASCCCATDSFVMTRTSDTVLAYSVSLIGQCFGFSTYAGNADYPTGYTLVASGNGVTLTITLSSDSNMLTIQSSFGASCGGTATRVGAPTTTSAPTNGNSNDTSIPVSDAGRSSINVIALVCSSALIPWINMLKMRH